MLNLNGATNYNDGIMLMEDYRGWKYVLDALMHWVQEYRVDGYMEFDYVDGIGWGNQMMKQLIM